MKWNKKELIKVARKEGCTEKFKSAADFIAWADENGIDFAGLDTSADITKAFNKTVTVDTDAGEEVIVNGETVSGGAEVAEVDPDDEEVKMEGEEDDEEMKAFKAFRASQKSTQRAAQKGATNLAADTRNGLSAESYKRIAARKRYDRKAALGKTAFTSADVMEVTNAFMRLSWLKNYANGEYPGKKLDMEIFLKAGGTVDNALGGFLVPDGVSDELIELKEQNGVARQLAGVTSMPLPKWDVNRFGDDVVVYKTAEGVPMTQSDMTFSQVTLLSEELGALSLQSNRLLRLSAIDIGDAFSRSAMRGFTKFEDDSFFNGANGFEGLATKVGANSTVDVTGITAWSGITLDNLLEWTGKLPGYTDQFAASEIPITCTRPVFQQVFRKYALAQGGSTMEDQLNAGELEFDGHPIILNNSMARTFANNAIAAYIGPFKHVTKFGELEGSMSFDSSSDRHFDSNQMAFRGLEEIAINCHDVNNVVDADGNNTSGVVALQVGT